MSAQHTLGPQLRLVEHYSDACPCIVDEQGFEIVQVEQIAVLLDYQRKLGINHWADSPRASRELTEEEAAALTRRIVQCVNAHDELVALLREVLGANGATLLDTNLKTRISAALSNATGDATGSKGGGEWADK